MTINRCRYCGQESEAVGSCPYCGAPTRHKQQDNHVAQLVMETFPYQSWGYCSTIRGTVGIGGQFGPGPGQVMILPPDPPRSLRQRIKEMFQ